MKPVEIAFVCVNYYCEDTIATLLETIAPGPGYMISITLVDNSGSMAASEAFSKITAAHEVDLLEPGRNLGYLGAFAWAVESRSLHLRNQFVILANPDLEISGTFFATLASTRYPDDIAVIAPSILNLPSHSQANPAMSARPSRRKMWVRKTVHANPYIFSLYDLLHRFKKRLRRRTESPRSVPMAIYAPHGALMIFRARYFEAGGSLEYFGFLFGEEIFIAEECRRIGKTILFDPRLHARHFEHVATSALGSSRLSSFAHESLSGIYDTYFAARH